MKNLVNKNDLRAKIAHTTGISLTDRQMNDISYMQYVAGIVTQPKPETATAETQALSLYHDIILWCECLEYKHYKKNFVIKLVIAIIGILALVFSIGTMVLYGVIIDNIILAVLSGIAAVWGGISAYKERKEKEEV